MIENAQVVQSICFFQILALNFYYYFLFDIAKINNVSMGGLKFGNTHTNIVPSQRR